MKKIRILFIFIFISKVTFSQEFPSTEQMNGIKLISASIDNLIFIDQLSPNELKEFVTNLGFYRATIDNDCIIYMKSYSFNNMEEVSKCSAGSSIVWYHAGDDTTIVDQFANEINKYYIGYDEKTGQTEYKLNYDGISYTFYLKRTDSYESITIVE